MIVLIKYAPCSTQETTTTCKTAQVCPTKSWNVAQVKTGPRATYVTNSHMKWQYMFWFFESELPATTNRCHSILHAVKKLTSEVKALVRERPWFKSVLLYAHLKNDVFPILFPSPLYLSCFACYLHKNHLNYVTSQDNDIMGHKHLRMALANNHLIIVITIIR